ncbi:MAG: tyrosine-protein kinase [Actinomycetota bacterium]|nr:tyrosine-protein kinase [Actinomycetota bacterium]
MELHDFLKVIRTRWATVLATTLVTALAAVAYSLLQTPLYEASTRLFVSTVGGTSASELYSGNRLSQERVLSYAQLLMGETLAQRTIDRLNLDMDARTLSEAITAKAKPDTVLIDVSVLDTSPVRARDIANALSEELVVMVRELETPAQGAAPDARVVVEQRATVPPEPEVPKKKRNLAVGILLGGILGAGLAILRDILDNTVKDRVQLEKVTGSGVVGVVPYDKGRRENPAIVFESDNSPTAESFRKLRTNLQFLSVDSPPRLIVITSSVPNESKSTTAINIALALAEADHNVLLIDGDMRRPSLARYLDMVGSVGLSTVLSGSASLDDATQESKFPRLKVLASGPTPPNPSELLGSRAAKKVLDELRDRYDYVIIDTSPLLAVTDGAILAAESDGAILLVRAGDTKRDQIAHSIGILNDVGATILGSVLSMVPNKRSGPYSYDYYGRTYGDRLPADALDRRATDPSR